MPLMLIPVYCRLERVSFPAQPQARGPPSSQMVTELRERASGKARLRAVPLTKDHRPGETSEKGV